MKTNFTVLCLLVLGLCSCEGYRCVTGHVKDKETGAPLDSVAITLLTRDNDVEYADSVGWFDVCNHMSGCISDCKDITVQISRLGYRSVILTNPEDSVFLLDRE